MHMGCIWGEWVFFGSSCLLLIYLHYLFLSMDDVLFIVNVVFSDMNLANHGVVPVVNKASAVW